MSDPRRSAVRGALGVLTGVGVACLVGPWLSPYPVGAVDLGAVSQSPSWAHWMGTDELGRDVLTRLLYGGRISMAVGLLAALVSTGVGSAVGMVAGYVGGWTDGLLMRFTDMAYAIPALPLLIVLASFTAASPLAVALIIGLLSWMGTARVVRGEVLSLRERDFVLAARTMGGGHRWILTRHILPNAVGPIVVAATLAVAQAILVESALSFLGLGVEPTTPTWGNLLFRARDTLDTQPWLAVFPGVAILTVVLAVSVLGEAVRRTVAEGAQP